MRNLFQRGVVSDGVPSTLQASRSPSRRQAATLGILADRETDQVPGTVQLISHSLTNKPLGSEKAETHRERISRTGGEDGEEKRTGDGKIILIPQPDDTPNDPLNWSPLRRDCALFSLGFYAMLGGGMTPILAAGFNQVAKTFDVSYSEVALTTGLYMMGLGVGGVITAPTAVLYGKRPVYLVSAVLFLLSSVWCALAPSYPHLVVARVFQGIAVSPVECLPSATIAEIFFLHERAFRIGIYTLLLLGGKNLNPLVSAAIIQAKDWRWVFWVVAIVVGFSGTTVFLFVPETFWDRTPRPYRIPRPLHERRNSRASQADTISRPAEIFKDGDLSASNGSSHESSMVNLSPPSGGPAGKRRSTEETRTSGARPETPVSPQGANCHDAEMRAGRGHSHDGFLASNAVLQHESNVAHDCLREQSKSHAREVMVRDRSNNVHLPSTAPNDRARTCQETDPGRRFTSSRRDGPHLSYIHSLTFWNGRLSRVNWFRVALRPFILFAYPPVLWSSMVYAISVGWLIVLSESVAHIYENRDSYNFSTIQVGLVYLSPFVGGILGSAVAGRVSDVVVRFMARRNRGIYEPEFRLVMAIPIALCTGVGLMGFGWSVEERDNFMVPTIFFGIISFGCCIGSTTAITYVVDCYRQFAAEALVTLNFSKNVLHGLVWSLFFPQWLQGSGPKTVFLSIGGIQVGCMLLTIPMYMYGKRARMWTVRKKMMERF